MLDPISLTAITAVLGAVGAGMANEAGKRAWESAGGLVRRVAGREVRAPAGPADLESVARLVHDRVRSDPAHARAWRAFAQSLPALATASLTGHDAVPRPEFPASTRFFTNRDEAMKKLDREASRAPDGRPRIALLHGAQGMGTSALAVHWGCREARRRFPDGQLYVDLRGSSTGGALDASAALHAVLRQLGLPEADVPPTVEDRIGRYRQLIDSARLLLVLDHAHSAAQVRGLVTSEPGVFLLAVATQPLAGLDALRVPVGPLRDRDAVRLLTHLVGKETVNGADGALPSFLSRCGGSPFALRVAAPRLSAPPTPARSPEVTAVPEPDPVRAAAEDAARLLSPEAARLYRLMSLRPWPAFGPGAAAAAADIEEAEAAALLDQLVEALLLERTGSDRYWYRPGVRQHAEEAAVREDGVAGCSAAVSRVVEGHLRLALRAADAALPESWRVPPLPDGLPRGAYASRAEAVEVLSSELDNVIQAVYAAEEFGSHETVVLLARTLWPLQLKVGRHDELLPALALAARTADTHFPDSRTAGALHFQLAHSLTEVRRFGEAETEARAAAGNESAAGHARGHASCVEYLGLLRLREWRYPEAYACFEEAGRVYDTIGQTDGRGADGLPADGAADLPRARALLERHKGRALRDMGRGEEARERLGEALRFFRESGDTYNTARTLTDLAEAALNAAPDPDTSDPDTSDPDTSGPGAPDPGAGTAGAAGSTDAAALAEASGLIDEAERLLTGEGAAYHLAFLRSLRQRCVSRPPE